MSVHEENLGFLHKNLARGKDKGDIFLKQREFCLEIKNNQRLPIVESSQKEIFEHIYNIISNDIWFHISKYIAPEDVQTFGLICRQTAALIRSKSFWNRLYKIYCRDFRSKLQLPLHLQFDTIKNFNAQIFRTCVIQALFLCYKPLVDWSKEEYSLNLLLGRAYISAWQKGSENFKWITCYQFRQHNFIKQSQMSNVLLENEELISNSEDIVNDWESLAVHEATEKKFSHGNNDETSPYEGVCLLIIFSSRFIPFQRQLTYGNHIGNSTNLRLTGTRRPLTSDLRDYNLELDFTDTINRIKTTVKYPAVTYKVLPWWHPDFKKYTKFDV